MAQSDARFGYRAKLARTDHDLSQPFGFTAAPGQLLPIWFDLATPGESYYMSHDMPLLRSIQFVAPAMINVKVHFETFFVPIEMIYEPFENSVYQIRNLRSSMYDDGNLRLQDLPLYNYSDAITLLKGNGYSRFRADAFRLADVLGLDPLNFITRAESGTQPVTRSNYAPNFFPYQLCAYHTIFEYYYRLDDKTQFFKWYCNLDSKYATDTFNLDFEPERMWQIHQRPWDFDYFTSAYNSPIVSDVNMQRVLAKDSYSFLNAGTQAPVTVDGFSVASNNKSVSGFSFGEGGLSADSLRQASNTAMIRQLFANEKLAMITGRTKKNYDAQTLAHFGVAVPHDVKHDITLIHHDSYDLNVQEVTSLASTEMSPLGELAGKSYSAGNGKQFKFTAPCHGVIMTIFSVEPKKRYITQFDRINAITDTYDVPTPEFDRLGNMPMYWYEVGTNYGGNNTNVIKWKERYYQYKRRAPKVTWFAYAANGTNQFGSYFLSSLPFAYSSFTSNAASHLPAPTDPQQRYAYIEPGCMDSLCVAHYLNTWQESSDGENWSNTPWLVYARDPFIVNSHIKCKKVSWMSKDGEPIYD